MVLFLLVLQLMGQKKFIMLAAFIMMVPEILMMLMLLLKIAKKGLAVMKQK